MNTDIFYAEFNLFLLLRPDANWLKLNT